MGVMVGERHDEAIFMGISYGAIALWKNGLAEHIDEWEDEDEIEVREFVVDIARLIEAKKQQALNLIEDGWRVGGKSLDFHDTLEEIRTLVLLSKALDEGK